jgi:hypothetical protein
MIGPLTTAVNTTGFMGFPACEVGGLASIAGANQFSDSFERVIEPKADCGGTGTGTGPWQAKEPRQTRQEKLPPERRAALLKRYTSTELPANCKHPFFGPDVDPMEKATSPLGSDELLRSFQKEGLLVMIRESMFVEQSAENILRAFAYVLQCPRDEVVQRINKLGTCFLGIELTEEQESDLYDLGVRNFSGVKRDEKEVLPGAQLHKFKYLGVFEDPRSSL